MLPDATEPLGEDAATAAFAALLNGQVGEDDAFRFLDQMSGRDETALEIAVAARALRARMMPVAAPPGAIDVCGTGGDGSHSLNVSTAVAIVVAACEVPVAKHGNRAASSRAGAADTLEALGLDLARASERAEQSLAELGLAFLFAQRHHPALAALAPVRKRLGRRTVFNLIGPLSNPARVRRQLIGIARPDYLPIVAQALRLLGTEDFMLVAGDEPLDELSVAGPSSWVRANGFTGRLIPAEAGLATHPQDALRGGDAAYNADALDRLLRGEPGAYRDAVLLNAAAALMVAGHARDWQDGVEEAAEAIDKGLARALLSCWIQFCR